MSKIKDHLDCGSKETREAWRIAQRQSEAYRKALGLSMPDLEEMERNNAVLVVEGYDCKVITKNTCGIPYGGSWRLMLQARPSFTPEQSSGGGTTYFETLNEPTHKHLVKLLEDEAYEIVNRHIWP